MSRDKMWRSNTVGRKVTMIGCPSLPHVGQLPDFAHVPVVHNSHMPIVPGDRDRIPTRLSNSAPVSSITLPANASTVLEVLRFGGGHVAPPFAWIAHILGQTACRCLSYFSIKYSCCTSDADSVRVCAIG